MSCYIAQKLSIGVCISNNYPLCSPCYVSQSFQMTMLCISLDCLLSYTWEHGLILHRFTLRRGVRYIMETMDNLYKGKKRQKDMKNNISLQKEIVRGIG